MMFALLLVLALLGSGAPRAAEDGKGGASASGSNVPHTTVGRDDCLLCHDKPGPSQVPRSHKGRANETCLTCHREAPVKGAEGADAVTVPVAPHPVDGLGDCLSCHGVGRFSPVPASHQGRDNSTCLLCHHSVSSSHASTPAPTGEDACTTCHDGAQAVLTFPNGDTLPIGVDGKAYKSSLHGDRLTCKACHRTASSWPHAPVTAASAREYVMALNQECKPCHFANFTKSLDGMHYRILSSGDTRAPVCTDCHGAHTVKDLRGQDQAISLTCARCHQDIYDQYATSVHGKALTEGNQDVPTCTDCHGAHTIADARSQDFHVHSPELCANCHTDPEVMGRYGISTNVLSSYLQDFHGVTVRFYQRESEEGTSVKATCVDCHGIHDIRATDDPHSQVIKANLVETCRKCHPDATENFPAAWLAHYEPSPSRFPIVYWVSKFYLVFIPATVGGLGLHMILDLYRIFLSRIRRRRSTQA